MGSSSDFYSDVISFWANIFITSYVLTFSLVSFVLLKKIISFKIIYVFNVGNKCHENRAFKKDIFVLNKNDI